MIKLFSKHGLVVDGGGRRRTVSFDRIRDDLAACFAACGVTEAWVADQVVFAVEEQLDLRMAERDREPLPEADLDAMVLSVLAASGYGDVGAKYRELRGAGPLTALAEGMAAWDDDRVLRILDRFLPVPPQRAAAVAEFLCGELRRLGLARVSDELIRQLGIHLLQTGAAAGGATVEPGDAATRLFPEGHWATRFGQPERDLLARGIVTVFPMSPVLPCARVGIDLRRLADAAGGRPLLEMAALAAFGRVCAHMPAILNTVRSEASTRCPHALYHPSHLVLENVDSFLAEELVPLCPREERRFLEDMEAIVDREVAAEVDYTVIVSRR